MTQTEVLEELKKLTPEEQLTIIEAALCLLREDLQQKKQLKNQKQKKQQLALAAKALLSDYKEDSELTIFTVLDNEDFHA